MLPSVPRRIRRDNVLIPDSSGQRCVTMLTSYSYRKPMDNSKEAAAYGGTSVLAKPSK